MQKRVPKGVIIFGVLLVITSILQMQKFLSFGSYYRVFQQLPAWLIGIRYSISITLRVMGFTAGIGILWRKNFARKLAIAIAIFTLCTLYWKHPYIVVHNYYKISFYFTQNPGVEQFVLSQKIKLYTIITLAVFYLVDIIFSSMLIYYFTRPKIKAQFC